MNESECAALLESADWHSPRLIAVFVVLGVINVMVILGNLLVIAAVYISSKLRTVTNLFIVSLAVADLLVGVAVLPFSSTLEVSKVSTGTAHLQANRQNPLPPIGHRALIIMKNKITTVCRFCGTD